jgi:murein DD-endopeptidase MepM/ murein hydrolase activator NlpD
MKNVLLSLFILPLFVCAQKTHTVGAKETLFSIGRQYNVHPRELAAFNNIPYGTGLNIGQVIKIPSKTTMAALPSTTPVATPEVKKEPVVATPEVKKEAKVPAPKKLQRNLPWYLFIIRCRKRKSVPDQQAIQ